MVNYLADRIVRALGFPFRLLPRNTGDSVLRRDEPSVNVEATRKLIEQDLFSHFVPLVLAYA
jgi:hypothetical protein